MINQATRLQDAQDLIPVTLRLTSRRPRRRRHWKNGIADLCAMFPAQEVQGMKVRNSLKSLKAKDGSYVVRAARARVRHEQARAAAEGQAGLRPRPSRAA
jgi:hypothetical protein